MERPGKSKSKAAAAIEIGSSSVRMNISQWDGDMIVPLDQLEKPILLGREVFTSGYISFDTVRQLSSILSGFCSVAREYEITKISVTATTALREASNRSHVLDHIMVRNKLDINVLEDFETSSIIFNELEGNVKSSLKDIIMVYGGTGTIDLAIRKNGRNSYLRGLNTGLLKIAEMIKETSEYSTHVFRAAEEYLHTFFGRRNWKDDFAHANTMVFSMGDMQPFFALCLQKPGLVKAELTRSAVEKACGDYLPLSFDQISAKLNIDSRRVGIAYAALSFLAVILNITKVKKIICIQTGVSEAVINLDLKPGAKRAYHESLRVSARISAQELAEKFECDANHVRFVKDTALELFEKLKKIHGLSRHHSFLLEIACELHEIGLYADSPDSQEAAFNIIKNAKVYGLKFHDILLAANIISPQKLLGVDRSTSRDSLLGESEILPMEKLHAILHLSDCLDFSRRQKAGIKDIAMEGNRLLICMESEADYTLEQWMFDQSAMIFREVFGIAPYLEVLSTYKIQGNA